MQKKRKRVLKTPIPSKGRPDPLPNMTAEKELAIANGLRRSKRQRWKPLAYWKNERIGYECAPGQSEPELIGAIRDGCPTPLLKRYVWRISQPRRITQQLWLLTSQKRTIFWWARIRNINAIGKQVRSNTASQDASLSEEEKKKEEEGSIIFWLRGWDSRESCETS